jgi:hypothetical protein
MPVFSAAALAARFFTDGWRTMTSRTPKRSIPPASRRGTTLHLEAESSRAVSFPKMQDILPEAVLLSLREHYYAAVMAAEIGYPRNAVNEESTTGALGHALFTPGIRHVVVGGRLYRWRATYEIVPSKGAGAAEKTFGADTVFQLEVLDAAGNVVRRKALMAQAKKNWTGANKKLLDQAARMLQYSPSAIVIDYRVTGFKGVPAGDVVEAGGNRRYIPREREKRLGEILGDDFVWCRRGDVGVFWNPLTQSLELETGVPVVRRITVNHLMTTTVQRLV